MQTNYYILAQGYGTANYDGSTYDSNTSGSAASGSSGGGILTDTGFDLILILTLASLLIFTALIIRFWKKPKRELALEPANVDESSNYS